MEVMSNYYELCNLVVYSLLLENVNSDLQKILLKNENKKSTLNS